MAVRFFRDIITNESKKPNSKKDTSLVTLQLIVAKMVAETVFENECTT